MSITSEKNESWLSKCKRIFIEQLWLVFLLAPLLIIAFLITEQYQPVKQQMMYAKNSKALSMSVEITSAELAMIVAKPLGELLAIEVYMDYKQASKPNFLMASKEDGGNVENEVYNKVVLKNDGMHLYARNLR
ncbi:MAG: hypothetical protein ACSHWN_06630 [Methylophilaceae bacterium]